MRHHESLLGTNVDIIRPLRILNYRIDWRFTRHTIDLAPGFATVTRHKHTRTWCPNPDSFRLFLIGGNTGSAWIETSIGKILPTLCGIDGTIQSGVFPRQNRRLLSYGIDGMDQRVDGVSQYQI